MEFKTIFGPFRIHSAAPHRLSTPEDENAHKSAGCNVLWLGAVEVMIDLLTDWGTQAMSRHQLAGMHHGDASYAGSPSWELFRDAVKSLFPFKHVSPTHQLTAAEKLLLSVLSAEEKFTPNNTHFQTTRANIEFTKATAVDLAIPEGRDPVSLENIRQVSAVCKKNGLILFLDACR